MAPAFRGDYLWDDNAITRNPLLTNPRGLLGIWTTPRSIPVEQHYWPVTYSTFWIEAQLFGLRPGVLRATNILLHTLNSLLLWRLLRLLRVPGAAFAAALFAVHPVHVESVAWAIERKGLLASLFSLLAAGAWWRGAGCARDAAAEAPSPVAWPRLLAATGLFALALLSKTSAVAVPVVLGLLGWSRGRLGPGRAVACAAPLLAVGLVLTAVDLAYLKGGEPYASGLSLFQRLALPVESLAAYAGKAVFPSPLALPYARWTPGEAGGPRFWVSLLAMAGVVAACAAVARRGQPGPALALASYVLLLAPVLGLVDFGYMEIAWFADRFQYLAIAAPLALAASIAVRAGAAQGARYRSLVQALAALLLLANAVLCFQRARVFTNTETLFSDTFRHNPDHWLVRNNLGGARLLANDLDGAIVHFKAALARHPANPDVLNNLAVALGSANRTEEAIAFAEAAVRAIPGDATCRGVLARLLLAAGETKRAEAEAREALRLEPTRIDHWLSVGTILEQTGRPAAALAQYRQALEQFGDRAPARLFFAMAWIEAAAPETPPADPPAALRHAEEAQRRAAQEAEPLDALQCYTVAAALAANGRAAEAIPHVEAALRIARGPSAPPTIQALAPLFEQCIGVLRQGGRITDESLRETAPAAAR